MGWETLLMVASYLCVVVAVGVYKGRQEADLEDYTVGGRQIPWWAVLGSLVATEVSAATYLAVPAVGFSENLSYLQIGIGSFLARIFVATVFIGLFYRIRCMSIYEFLGQRFGGTSQFTASVYFLLTRILASGVRLMIAVTGFSVIVGLPFGWSLLLFGLLTLLYTAVGGIKAVIWTDCIQAVVFLSAGLAAVAWILTQIGLTAVLAEASPAGRLELFQLAPAGPPTAWLNDSTWVVTAVIFGFVSTVAAFSTDQDMVQRLLSSRSGKQARGSLILSGFVAFPVAALFLFLGVCLFAWFQINPAENFPLRSGAETSEPDAERVMAFFITTEIPFWLRGLLLTGVLAAAMSSLDSAMAAMSASAVTDLLRPRVAGRFEKRRAVTYGRWLTVLFAALLLLTAWVLRDGGTFLWLAFKVTSLTYGSLLGIFLLGRFTRRGADRGNLWAMLSGSSVTAFSLWMIETGRLPLAWTWLIVMGTLITFLVGILWRSPQSPGIHSRLSVAKPLSQPESGA